MDEKLFPRATLRNSNGLTQEVKNMSAYHYYLEKTAERIILQLQSEGLDQQDLEIC